jgi:hypothetical protein
MPAAAEAEGPSKSGVSVDANRVEEVLGHVDCRPYI